MSEEKPAEKTCPVCDYVRDPQRAALFAFLYDALTFNNPISYVIFIVLFFVNCLFDVKVFFYDRIFFICIFNAF